MGAQNNRARRLARYLAVMNCATFFLPYTVYAQTDDTAAPSLARETLGLRSQSGRPAGEVSARLEFVALAWNPTQRDLASRVALAHVAGGDHRVRALAASFRRSVSHQLAAHEDGRAPLSAIVEAAHASVASLHTRNGPLMVAVIRRSPAAQAAVTISLDAPIIGEADLADVDVSARSYAAGVLRRMRAEKTLTPAMLERYRLLLEKFPGLKAQMRITPGLAGEPPTIDTRLSQDRVGASLAIDDRAPGGIGRRILFTNVNVNDVITHTDYAKLEIINNFSPGTALLFDGEYGVFLGRSGMRIALEAFSSLLTPETDGAPFAIDNKIFTLAAEYPLLLQDKKRIHLTSTLSWGRALAREAGAKVFDERRTTTSIGVSAAFKDKWRGETSLEIVGRRGWDVFNATARGDRLATRGGDGATFFAIGAEAKRKQALSEWATLTVEAYAQTATESLLILDQCVYGGRDFGRAFELNSIFGDRCILAAAELEARPDFLKVGVLHMKPYAFVDGGAMEQIGFPDPVQAKTAALMSAGGGVRIAAGKTASAQLEVATPLRSDRRPPQVGARRFFFRVSKSF